MTTTRNSPKCPGSTQHIYIDEYGDSGLDLSLPDVSSHFIIAAAIVNKDDEHKLFAGLDEVANQHFQGSAIKSSNVRDKRSPQRRKRILDSLASLDFQLFVLVVDKKRLLSGRGYQFYDSFVKNLSGKTLRSPSKSIQSSSRVC